VQVEERVLEADLLLTSVPPLLFGIEFRLVMVKDFGREAIQKTVMIGLKR
jgi:hypothetical protein